MDHLEEARLLIQAAEYDTSGLALRNAQLAIAHGIIALVECLGERNQSTDWKSIAQQMMGKECITAEKARRLNENAKAHIAEAVDKARL